MTFTALIYTSGHGSFAARQGHHRPVSAAPYVQTGAPHRLKTLIVSAAPLDRNQHVGEFETLTQMYSWRRTAQSVDDAQPRHQDVRQEVHARRHGRDLLELGPGTGEAAVNVNLSRLKKCGSVCVGRGGRGDLTCLPESPLCLPPQPFAGCLFEGRCAEGDKGCWPESPSWRLEWVLPVC